ncbi:MAG: NADH dehydrogenase [Ignavibacteria bacterium GWA2_55_11]|nr:MAG: NADH dehydrogenase [Ignavibacteria bacterium GWA2_55_11]OGU44070.1 MAG: NADH dehydrogenase [Ignavibacteria bacterium GWC2_56_12]OGU62453.1 MAG: NADH dehydrogenase [Ignavibacteria bacterium RIFCSPHIGHO2_02_FULL_56_12]OGU73890.1 MAG: NADH dehydrogenase [Ignavibacteria bacterium RIFCSPLOWO2_12_FULL_56_21]OGU75608.1 MAG: NADH dehydrogenase [Ignavibacteria bacterium RIFCSPLOWO2_02_FULL_55_14]HAV24035.1 NADH-quinone oxidoreductase subunit M [Bacteroidota bacterium]
MTSSILSWTIFLPLAGVVVLAAMKNAQVRSVKIVGCTASVVTFAVSLFLWFGYDAAAGGFQFVERVAWISSLNISYHVGIDGLSLLLILLTTVLTPLALIGTWNSITNRVRDYTIMILVLEVAMVGVFAALDLFLFYVFWEAMLIPMVFIIGMWGGQDRVYAAVKFFLYTLVGSLLMLVAILALGYAASQMPGGQFTTNLLDLYAVGPRLASSIQLWMFLAFALSFAIKVPVFPLHTWLPDAHVQAPTAGSVLLAGVLLKMGTFGFMRYCLPLFPEAALRAMPYVATLAVISIVYGALVAMVQTDIKKLVAYSSVSHLGFVMLGIFSMTEEGMQGAMIQMVNHGLSTGALFLLVGMVYDRTHTRTIDDYGGLAKVMPVFAAAFLFISLSSIGLPGLNGFVGEFLVLLGAFRSTALHSTAYAAIAATGVILSAVYMLWMYQRVMLGPTRESGKYGGNYVFDIGRREIGVLVAIAVLVVWIGVYPASLLTKSAGTARNLIHMMDQMQRGQMPRYAESPIELLPGTAR